MEVIIAMRLHIGSSCNTCITHDGRSAAGLKLRSGTTLIAESECMVGAKLVAHFVCSIIYYKWITFRCYVRGKAPTLSNKSIGVGAAVPCFAYAGNTTCITIIVGGR